MTPTAWATLISGSWTCLNDSGDKENSAMGFIRRQEVRAAIRFLVWKYQKMNLAVPALSELQRQAGKIVDDAHRTARKTGANVISIIKELIEDLKK